MGSYLSEPITEKVSTDESDDRVSCGASCMQGWRVTQEDAHNCITDFDQNTSLFAVYDGHGGHEVAQYCALHLPNYIKNTEAYKTEDMEKALIDAFLGFDSTLATSQVISTLKEIANNSLIDQEDEDEENVLNLYEEAAMPIEQVIEKYQSNLMQPNLKKITDENGKAPVSPYLTAKNKYSTSCGPSSSGVKIDSTSTADSADADAVTSSSSSALELTKTVTSSSCSATETVKTKEKEEEVEVEKKCPSPSPEIKPDSTDMNGDCEVDSSSFPQTPENGVVTKGKGKALVKTKGVVQKQKKVLPKRNAQQLYNHLLETPESDESEDEEDVTFEGVDSNSDDDEEEEEEGAMEEESEESSDDEDDADDEEEDECNDDEDEFARNMREEPGSDSGCTAVVALLHGKELYVANAGDSRCIVCRNGEAVEMSFDHKPEDDPEKERILKAGGKVTCDGRVNGGLNLSRAIGDHAYKQNKELSDREQMITALPDVKKLTIQPKDDEFMVLACDGIWNYMSSQEVVDFVRPKIQKGYEKLSQICEEMFDHCLAPNTMGDGTGCDNMTALIVQFKPSITKRGAEESPEVDPKRAKCLDN